MSNPTLPNTDEVVLPVYTEDVSVARRKVERRRVRVRVQTTTREHPVDEALTHERIEVERVTIGRPVDVVPPIREEGDTIVISVVEEIVAVERRLILKEEIRLRRVRTTERHRESVTVHEQHAAIEWTGPVGRESMSPRALSAVTQPENKDADE